LDAFAAVTGRPVSGKVCGATVEVVAALAAFDVVVDDAALLFDEPQLAVNTLNPKAAKRKPLLFTSLTRNQLPLKIESFFDRY
jgi:hypothetical protein